MSKTITREDVTKVLGSIQSYDAKTARPDTYEISFETPLTSNDIKLITQGRAILEHNAKENLGSAINKPGSKDACKFHSATGAVSGLTAEEGSGILNASVLQAFAEEIGVFPKDSQYFIARSMGGLDLGTQALERGTQRHSFALLKLQSPEIPPYEKKTAEFLEKIAPDYKNLTAEELVSKLSQYADDVLWEKMENSSLTAEQINNIAQRASELYDEKLKFQQSLTDENDPRACTDAKGLGAKVSSSEETPARNLAQNGGAFFPSVA